MSFTDRATPWRSALVTLTIGAAVLSFGPGKVSASYEFIEDGTFKTLATLSLTDFPGGSGDLSTLAFTEDGADKFGFDVGVFVPGSWSGLTAGSSLIHQEPTGLAGGDAAGKTGTSSFFRANDLPTSSLFVDAAGSSLLLRFSHEPLGDSISLKDVPGINRLAFGAWTATSTGAIPEPTSAIVWAGLASFGWVRIARRRRRRC